MKVIQKENIVLAGLIGTTILAGGLLTIPRAIAGTDVVDKITITVPPSCSLNSTGGNSHTAEILNGHSNSNVGESTIKAYCNDSEGFAIYAVGFTDDEPGKNVLTSTTLSSTYDIPTGTLTSGNASQWAMKVSTISSPAPTYPIIIAGSSNDTAKEQGDPDFTSFQEVPSMYTKVAYRLSSTDTGTNATGSTIKTTYQTYISPTQPAGSYTGQVRYTLVHPNDHRTPATHPATLDTGQTVNSKLKSLAATVVSGSETTKAYDSTDSYVKSLAVHLETPAPNGFTPSEANTISASTSDRPIYIVFDNTNSAGIMHLYTEGDQISLPSDSSYTFFGFRTLADLSAISDWDSSNVTNMMSMFSSTGYSATTFSLDLSGWDTASVTNMNGTFALAGWDATIWSISGLSEWNTTSVTDMSGMFGYAGHSATNFSLDLSGWNTASVIEMGGMFINAGYSATTFSLDLSGWNTASVTNMSGMFHSAGYSATTFSLDLSGWNTASVTNMGGMFGCVGYNATNFSLDLSGWNTASVTNMVGMFGSAGYNATTFSLDLSGWNTASVIEMGSMFSYAGYNATNWSVTISATNGNNINNTTSRLYGKTTSVYNAPDSGRSFTLAQ